MSSRRRELEQLERGLHGDEYRQSLRHLSAAAPLLAQFADWGEVVTALRVQVREGDEADALLRPILSAWHESRESPWAEVLLAAFWHRLEAIHQRKWQWERDEDERWQCLVCAFLQAICRLDPRATRSGLARAIRNRTIHYFHDQCRARWPAHTHETAVAPEDLDAITQRMAGGGQVPLDLEEERAAAQEVLWAHYRAGALSRDDYLLLSATRVLGQSVAEYARQHNLDYQAVKKRRQRVEAALARLQTENLSSLCPRDPRRGALS